MQPKLRFKGFNDEWKEKKISEISQKMIGGGTPNTNNKIFWNGNIPWIQSSNLNEDSVFDVKINKHVTNEAINKTSVKLIPKNSIAIVTRVGVGKICYMPFEYTTSQDFLSLSELKSDPIFWCIR